MANRGIFGAGKADKPTKQLIDRVVGAYMDQGRKDKYFDSAKSAQNFESELKLMLSRQVFTFDAPVWQNVGGDGPWRISNQYILSVDDNIKSIFNWYTDGGQVFKRGASAGINLSRVRGSCEKVSSTSETNASGPVPFIRGADSTIDALSAGGSMCDAARTIILDVDHPDIERFVDYKTLEKQQYYVLHSTLYNLVPDKKDDFSTCHNNTKSIVRVSDEFMKAVEVGAPFALRARCGGDIVETVDARDLFRKIACATWDNGNPSIEYDGTINAWHTTPIDGKITASVPGSGYMSVDDTACITATIDISKFLNDKNKFDIDKFILAVENIVTAMDLSVSFGEFITEKVSTNTRKYRSLGLGYSGLDALLKSIGAPYDSDAGRFIASAIMSLLSATAYRRSAELAAHLGAYECYARNYKSHIAIVRKHAAISLQKTDEIVDNDWPTNLEDIIFAANREWSSAVELGVESGWRNAQISLLSMGETTVEPMAQIRMMAAIQPFLSGAISATINVPESTTIADIEKIYMAAWKSGLKSVVVHRDNCDQIVDNNDIVELTESTGQRRELPGVRSAHVYSYEINGTCGQIVASAYADGKLGEVFIKSAEQDASVDRVMDILTISLQYGVPLSEFVERFIDRRPDPIMTTGDPDIPHVHSTTDYIFRRLAMDYIDEPESLPNDN